MTPDPTVVEPLDPALDGGTDVDEHTDWSEMAFGGQSSDGAAQPSANNGSLPLLFGFIGVILGIGFLRSWWFPGILAGLLFMLFMHEFGHYITARISGMKVTEFFIGFGPKIWSFQRGETEYGVKGIPAGAYVRIMGMTNLDDIDPAEEHRTYRSQPYWQRMMTICAGSAMHFMMALIALIVLFASYSYSGFNGPPWAVDVVVPGSTAAALNIEPGDQIRSINGDGFDNWDQFGEVVSQLERGPVQVVIERDGEQRTLNGELGLRPKDVLLRGFGLAVLVEDPALGEQVSLVSAQFEADQLGIEQGDIVVSAGGVQRPTEIALANVLLERDGGEISIEVLRGGGIVSIPATARATTDVDLFLSEVGVQPDDLLVRIGNINNPSAEELREALAAADGDVVRIQVLRGFELVVLEGPISLDTTTAFRGFFGVGPSFAAPVDHGLRDSIGLGIRDFGTVAKTNLVGLVDLANPTSWLGSDDDQVAQQDASSSTTEDDAVQAPDNCDGPDTNRPLSVVGIGRLISCSESADQVIFLFAMVNIFIGIFNLVPLLPLDGGHALIATYERGRGLVTRKPHQVDAAKLIPVTWVVILLLVGLGLYTTTLDIFSW